jgi:hypothetical protein
MLAYAGVQRVNGGALLLYTCTVFYCSRMLTYADVCWRMQVCSVLMAARYSCLLYTCIRQHTSAYVSIRQHTSAYVSGALLVPAIHLHSFLAQPYADVC